MRTLIHRIQEVYRRYRKVAAYAVLALSIGALGYLAWLERDAFYQSAPSYPVAEDAQDERATSSAPTATLATSRPTRLVIPKLGIDAGFEEPLGLNPDRTVGVPEGYTTVGWYDGSPTPGSLGPSVILGHIDSYEGPAVFYHLGQLVPGDRFTVTREDGTNPEFVVERVERYAQDQFPTESVYGPIDYAGIRLITCSGKYDRTTHRYSHNLVVYGRLVEPTEVR